MQGEVVVDWLSGANAHRLLAEIIDTEGESVSKISGYATDRLGVKDDETLVRFAQRTSHCLGRAWRGEVTLVRGKRFLVLCKDDS